MLATFLYTMGSCLGGLESMVQEGGGPIRVRQAWPERAARSKEQGGNALTKECEPNMNVGIFY